MSTAPISSESSTPRRFGRRSSGGRASAVVAVMPRNVARGRCYFPYVSFVALLRRRPRGGSVLVRVLAAGRRVAGLLLRCCAVRIAVLAPLGLGQQAVGLLLRYLPFPAAEGALRRVLRGEREQRYEEQGELGDPLAQGVRRGITAPAAHHRQDRQLVQITSRTENDHDVVPFPVCSGSARRQSASSFSSS